VASLPDASGLHAVTLAAPAATRLSGVTAENVPANETPADVAFPLGRFGFRLVDLPPGAATTVELIIPSDTRIDTYYKFGPTTDNPTPHAYEFLFDGTTGAEIHGNRITLHLVDGGRGDSDLTANGVIVDPGAPAVEVDIVPTRFRRMYNRNSDFHFYTTSLAEFQAVQSFGYEDETTGRGGFNVSANQAAETVPLHRLYGPSGQHYYTHNSTERDLLVNLGWRFEKDEGFVFSTATSGTTEIFRLYNRISGGHLFTESVNVRDAVLSFPGWELHSSLGFAFAVLPGAPARRAAVNQALSLSASVDADRRISESSFASTTWPAHRALTDMPLSVLTPGVRIRKSESDGVIDSLASELPRPRVRRPHSLAVQQDVRAAPDTSPRRTSIPSVGLTAAELDRCWQIIGTETVCDGFSVWPCP
jgi:hypothetical protein